jgi:hypothetical protein
MMDIEGLIAEIKNKDNSETFDKSVHSLQAMVDNLLANGTHGLGALRGLIDSIESKLDDDTSGLDALKTLIDALEAKLDKLAGEVPVSGSVAGNWNSGTATSGETGADVVTIGASDTRKKLHSLLLNISDFQAGAKVTVKLFMQINDTERKVYEQEFKQGTDPDGLWIVNGTVGIHEVLRVEVESNKAADDSVSMDYDYMLEAM